MRTLPTLVTLAGLAISVAAQPTLATPPIDGVFRPELPFSIDDLPRGRAKSQLESLPLSAQEHAIDWLNSFSFHKNDLEFINFDDEGGVFYQDIFTPDTTRASTDAVSGSTNTTPLEAATNVFALHSKPGASKVFFLDFDGHIISGTAWNGTESSYSATAFSTDSDFNNFSDAERTSIHEIWHRIAEDFAPFDIDVTTEQPATMTSTTGRLLITRNTDTTGKAMPYSDAGGVAYVGVWGNSSYASYYSPALVYYNNLASSANYIAEAASHEAGHNLNLGHDGTSTAGYYTGHGAGYVSWAPVMGVGYYQNVTQWSKGEYSDASQTQDDIAILAGQLAYRSDDHGNGIATATELQIAGDGSISVSNPQTDPANTLSTNKGIIETRNDIDTFSFTTGDGNIDISAIPAWDAFYRTSKRGANLDIELTLLDDTGIIAISDPTDNTDARITQTLPAGRYYLEVSGAGNSTSPYSDYGSLGQYFITGSVVATSTDSTTPNPDPMAWLLAPYTVSKDSIQMTAVTATDDSGVVEYQFRCITGDSACANSPWQSSSTYLATGLSPGTTYSFQVIARDLSNNLTIASPSVSAITYANQNPSASNDSGSGNEDNTLTINVLSNDSDANGDSLSVSSVTNATNGTTSTNGTNVTYTPKADYHGTDTFSYTVSDGFGGTASALVTVTINPVNDAPTAVNDSASVETNSTVLIDVLFNDSDKENDTLTLVSVSSGNKGSATIINGSTVSYTTGSKRGSDTVIYTVSDGKANSTASIAISIGSGSGSGSGGNKGKGRR